MQTVTLNAFVHRNQECIGIYYPNTKELNTAIRKLPGIKWSQTNKCWWLPLSKENYTLVTTGIGNTAKIDSALLKIFLEQRKRVVNAEKEKDYLSPGKVNTPVTIQKQQIKFLTVTKDTDQYNQIATVNAHVLPTMELQLKLKGYSASTIKTYLNEVGVFLKTIKKHPADTFTTERIKDYLLYCSEKMGLTENTLHSRMNALKFYYEQVLKREKFFWDIPRPKKGLQLPKVLSKEEMIRLIKAIENIKHKTMIMLGYACGLRVSEITALELKDIDEDRRLLFIRRAKGKKDRVVGLSPVMIVMLREYKKQYKPLAYLFEGQQKEKPYSTRSLESIIKAAKAKAGINKTGSMHMLRHSFATHLIDKGTDVVFIQKLLGHNDIKTTLRYLHVTNKDMLNILSPLEDIKDFL